MVWIGCASHFGFSSVSVFKLHFLDNLCLVNLFFCLLFVDICQASKISSLLYFNFESRHIYFIYMSCTFDVSINSLFMGSPTFK